MAGGSTAELCAASWDSDLARVGLPCVGLHTRATEEARVVDDDAGGAGPTSVMSCSRSRRGAGVVVVVVGKGC